MTEGRKLSFSSIQRHGYAHNGRLYGCPFSYYLKYGTSIEPTTVDAKNGTFGQVIHKVVEEFYPLLAMGNLVNYNSASEYFFSVLEGLFQTNWDYSLSDAQYKDGIAILKKYTEYETQRYDNFINGRIAQFLPMYRELKVPEPFNIRIDKVFPDHTLVDYKTTKDIPANTGVISDLNTVDVKYVLQTGLYAISYYNKYGIWPPKMIFHFLRTNAAMVIPINSAAISLATSIANQVTAAINDRKFPKNSGNCTYCDYRHVCGLETINLISTEYI